MALNQIQLPQEIINVLVHMTVKQLHLQWTIHETADSTDITLQWQKQSPTSVSTVFMRPSKSNARIIRDRLRQKNYFVMKDREFKRMDERQVAYSARTVPNATVSTQKITDMCDQQCQTEDSPSMSTGTMTATVHHTSASVQTSTVDHHDTARSTTPKVTKVRPSSVSSVIPDKRKTIRRTEDVMKRRVKENKQEYLIKWQDLPPNKNTWVPESNLDSVALAIVNSESSDIMIPGPRPETEHYKYAQHVTYMQQHRDWIRQTVLNRTFSNF